MLATICAQRYILGANYLQSGSFLKGKKVDLEEKFERKRYRVNNKKKDI